MDSGNGSNNGIFSGDIDPEIASLMGIEPASSDGNSDQPDFSALFDESQPSVEPDETLPHHDVDLTRTAFPAITRYQTETPFQWFADKNFYRNALSGIGETSQRLHKLMTLFLNTQDPKEKSIHRGKLIAAFWNYLENIAMRVPSDSSEPKTVVLRYGAVLPNLLNAQQRETISRIVFDNDTGEPVSYIDEWLKQVATGQVNPSATDETKAPRKNTGDNHQILAKLEKLRGQQKIQLNEIRSRMNDIETYESGIVQKAELISRHERHPEFASLNNVYNAEQRSALGELQTFARNLSALDKELTREFHELSLIDRQLNELSEKARSEGIEEQVDNDTLHTEFNTVRQMAKMCVGRQGNHMPILMKQYFRPDIKSIATRENVIAIMTTIESLDPGVFIRVFKRQQNRIVPYVILLPCYGDRGVCWEPFEKFNRATSRGRIAIPLYPKNPRVAVIAALADLRWQVAKEKAQHYWMEEGLTGMYYQWFSSKKLRGDVKEYFIQDYVLWITKESEGTQKLDKEVRGIFWRHVPFPEAIRNDLKNRGFVYAELFKKDINRSMSDGY